MKCFIVTKAVRDRFRVLDVINKYGWDPTFCCDTRLAKVRLERMGVQPSQIVLSDLPENPGIQGVSRARDFICRQVMPRNEWCIWIDDNVEKITGIPAVASRDKLNFNDGRNWRELFTRELTPGQLKYQIRKTIERAEKFGTIFCGFANENNYFFRKNKWQDFGYCRTQFALYKNDGSTWFPFDTMMWEDGFKSIDVVARYGQIVINRHVKAEKPAFEKGGIGSFERRLPWLQDNCSKLVRIYPGLLKYREDHLNVHLKDDLERVKRREAAAKKVKEDRCTECGKMFLPPILLTGNTSQTSFCEKCRPVRDQGAQYGDDKAEGFHIVFAKCSPKTIEEWRKANGYL